MRESVLEYEKFAYSILPRRHIRRRRGPPLTPEQKAEIRRRYKAGFVTQSELALEFKVSPSHVSDIVNGVVR